MIEIGYLRGNKKGNLFEDVWGTHVVFHISQHCNKKRLHQHLFIWFIIFLWYNPATVCSQSDDLSGQIKLFEVIIWFLMNHPYEKSNLYDDASYPSIKVNLIYIFWFYLCILIKIFIIWIENLYFGTIVDGVISINEWMMSYTNKAATLILILKCWSNCVILMENSLIYQ